VPIRPELRPFYGPQWRLYRARLIELRGKNCRFCHRWVEKWLNLAHETHDPRTSSTIFLCPACHQRHDTAHRIFVMRRNHAREYGQLWLLPEIEAERFVPAVVQLWLFPPTA